MCLYVCVASTKAVKIVLIAMGWIIPVTIMMHGQGNLVTSLYLQVYTVMKYNTLTLVISYVVISRTMWQRLRILLTHATMNTKRTRYDYRIDRVALGCM